MKISRNTSVWFGVLCLALLAHPAAAQSRLQTSSELSGVENVLGVIRNVNLRQTDQRSNQFIMDIMDTKTDVYGQLNDVPNSKASVVTHGKQPSHKVTPLPPARRLKAF
jgi:hypothetical protein